MRQIKEREKEEAERRLQEELLDKQREEDEYKQAQAALEEAHN